MAQGNSENGDEDNVVVVVVVVVGGGGGVGDLVEGNTESSSMLDPHWLSMTGDILLLSSLSSSEKTMQVALMLSYRGGDRESDKFKRFIQI